MQQARTNADANLRMVSDWFYPQPGGVESHIYQLGTVGENPYTTKDRLQDLVLSCMDEEAQLTIGPFVEAH